MVSYDSHYGVFNKILGTFYEQSRKFVSSSLLNKIWTVCRPFSGRFGILKWSENMFLGGNNRAKK